MYRNGQLDLDLDSEHNDDDLEPDSRLIYKKLYHLNPLWKIEAVN